MKFKQRTEADYQRTIKRLKSLLKRERTENEKLKKRIVQVDSSRFESMCASHSSDMHFQRTGRYYD